MKNFFLNTKYEQQMGLKHLFSKFKFKKGTYEAFAEYYINVELLYNILTKELSLK